MDPKNSEFVSLLPKCLMYLLVLESSQHVEPKVALPAGLLDQAFPFLNVLAVSAYEHL